MHIALFGGSFNPPHLGHLLAAACVRAVAGVDRVWLMPAFRHPFGKALAPFEDRVALCEAMARLVRDVEVSRIEEQGDGRTLVTLENLARLHPQHSWSLVVGQDILAEAPRWYAFDRILERARLVVLGRAGTPPGHAAPPGALVLTDVPLPAVSSTEVRARLARGDDVSHFVARDVLEEIRRRRLYGTR